MNDGFSTLVSSFDAEQWRVVSVLACERKLTLSALQKLGLSLGLEQWLVGSVGQGLVLEQGIVYGMPYTRNTAGERAMAIEPSFRPFVLRRLAEKNALETVQDDGRAIVGDNSLAGFMTALYSGDLTVLVREVTAVMRRSVRGEEASVIRGRLREAVCSSLDHDWLFRTWGESSWILIEQVLADSLVSLEPVDSLYDRAVSQSLGAMSANARRLLAEHAWLRGDSEVLEQLVTQLPIAEQLPLRAAQCILRGDSAAAQELLNELCIRKNAQKLVTVWPTSVTVLLALLALGREPNEGIVLAKRLLQRLVTPEVSSIVKWPTAPYKQLLAKAVRLLLRRMTTPESDRLRLSPHQQPSSAPAWEILLCALTVQLEDCDAVTRLSWTRRLVADGNRWAAAGYAWVARQALHLAKALSPEESEGFESLLVCPTGELLLACLLEREPEYRRALRALERFAETAESSERVVSRRVAWFLDMSCGELAKPSLEEYRASAGWTRGARVEFDELRAQKHALPSEDVAVLTALDSAPRIGRIAPEAVEALCGHPRVFNGARGRQPVEVVRGHCRIETRQERGHLVIEVEPAGAEEGVHVVVEGESRVVGGFTEWSRLSRNSSRCYRRGSGSRKTKSTKDSRFSLDWRPTLKFVVRSWVRCVRSRPIATRVYGFPRKLVRGG